MKKVIITGLFFITLLSTTQAQYRTERTGYEGDYFSLEGAIELFKEARSIRDFERKINSKTTYVNNLDLNYDGRIDYIRVEHRRQGDFHAIVLQIPLDKYDLQDVAVIEIEKIGRREAVLQIIGDEDLYGTEVIVEPFVGDGFASNSGRSTANYVSNDYVNVYYWPAVQSIFDHQYQVYVSPYRWSYYPGWWSPWRPYSWSVYHPRIRNYFRHCHVVKIYRAPRAHRFYRNHRVYSQHIAQRTAKLRQQHRSSGHHSTIKRNTTRSEVYGSSNEPDKKPKRVETQNRVSAQTNRTSSKLNPHRSPSSSHRRAEVTPRQHQSTTTRKDLNNRHKMSEVAPSKSPSPKATESIHPGAANRKKTNTLREVKPQASPRQYSREKSNAKIHRSSPATKKIHPNASKVKDPGNSQRKKVTNSRSKNQ